MSVERYIENVVTLQLDPAICIGCGMCVEVCPRAVFELRDGKAVILERDACIECGACALNCPVQALHVNSGAGCATGLINQTLTGSPSCCGKGGCCSGKSDASRLA